MDCKILSIAKQQIYPGVFLFSVIGDAFVNTKKKQKWPRKFEQAVKCKMLLQKKNWGSKKWPLQTNLWITSSAGLWLRTLILLHQIS